MSEMNEPRCACGQPLHYSDAHIRKFVETGIEERGTHVRVEIGERAYLVQRHYLALHGLKAWEAEQLTRRGILRRV